MPLRPYRGYNGRVGGDQQWASAWLLLATTEDQARGCADGVALQPMYQ